MTIKCTACATGFIIGWFDTFQAFKFAILRNHELPGFPSKNLSTFMGSYTYMGWWYHQGSVPPTSKGVRDGRPAVGMMVPNG